MRLGIGIFLTAGVKELTAFVVVAEHVVRDADVAGGIGLVGIELEDHFGALQRILEFLVPDVNLAWNS